IVWRATYTAFGEATVDPDSSIENNLRFPGQYYDQETGLHHNYFRDYDPSKGRYIQSDPIRLRGGINIYTYVEGNPLRYLDVYGLDKTSWDGFSPLGDGRGKLDGPRNGNWGGKCWSGGQYSCGA